MESHGNVEEKRKKANAFLRELLSQSATKSSEEISQSITNLAFESTNPVRDLFLTVVPSDATSATPSSKLRSPKILRLPRRENKPVPPAAKPPISTQSTSVQKDHGISSSSEVYSEGNQATTKPSFQANEDLGDDFCAVPYRCILCSEDMSSKGVCKRHLDEQHVSSRLFRCEKCGKDHSTKAEAKKHVNSCGVGIFTWIIVKPPPRKVYASEFKEECFSSKSTYLEHLLKLSKRDAARPQASLHCKLRALLSHQSLRLSVNDMSQELYGSPIAWRSMQWTNERLQSAIKDLEEAVIVHENGAIEFGGIGSQKGLNIHLFLQKLLCDGTPPKGSQIMSNTSLNQLDGRLDPAPGANHLENPMVAGTPFIPPSPMDYLPESNVSSERLSGDSGDGIMYVTRELKVKRQLSDESRFKEDTREPPGPSGAAIHFHSPFNASKDGVQDTGMPDMNSAILPYRSHEGNMIPHGSEQGNLPRIHPYGTHAVTPSSFSAATSEVTLVSGHQEPRLPNHSQESIFWTPDQNTTFATHMDIAGKGDLPYGYNQYPSEVSIRTPSIATENTCVDTSEERQKLDDFATDPAYPITAFGNLIHHQFYGMG